MYRVELIERDGYRGRGSWGGACNAIKYGQGVNKIGVVLG